MNETKKWNRINEYVMIVALKKLGGLQNTSKSGRIFKPVKTVNLEHGSPLFFFFLLLLLFFQLQESQCQVWMQVGRDSTVNEILGE